jgi:hypothetical protein
MYVAVSPWAAHDALIFASSMLPVLNWDGRTPMSLIGQVEARLAAGTRFEVLAPTSPLGCAADRGFLDGWWRAAQPRLSGMCAGWATIVRGADVNPGHLSASADRLEFADFPIRACADRAEALLWLRGQLAKTDQASEPHHAQ